MPDYHIIDKRHFVDNIVQIKKVVWYLKVGFVPQNILTRYLLTHLISENFFSYILHFM